MHQFYNAYAADGRLPLRPYLLASIRFRAELTAGRLTPETVAAREKLNAKYFRTLVQALRDSTPSFPLDEIRALAAGQACGRGRSHGRDQRPGSSNCGILCRLAAIATAT